MGTPGLQPPGSPSPPAPAQPPLWLGRATQAAGAWSRASISGQSLTPSQLSPGPRLPPPGSQRLRVSSSRVASYQCSVLTGSACSPRDRRSLRHVVGVGVGVGPWLLAASEQLPLALTWALSGFEQQSHCYNPSQTCGTVPNCSPHSRHRSHLTRLCPGPRGRLRPLRAPTPTHPVYPRPSVWPADHGT